VAEPEVMNAPVDRRMAVTGLSPAMREVRIRLARDEMYAALATASQHALAGCLTLEIDDDVLTEQHLVKFIAAAQKVAEKRRELRALLASPAMPPSAASEGGHER
jgi:hypothetical protein